jgi:hypothetical protein
VFMRLCAIRVLMVKINELIIVTVLVRILVDGKMMY